MQLRLFRLTALGLLFSGAVYGMHRVLFGAPPPAEPVLTTIRGTVEPGSGRLRTVKTGAESSVMIALPGGATVVLGAESEAAVVQLEASLQVVQLRSGALRAMVPALGRRIFRVEAETTGLTVEALDGDFSVQRLGTREAALECGRGEVWYSHGGWPRRLGAGEELRGRPLGLAGALGTEDFPGTVLLKASWAKTVRSRASPLPRHAGETAVGAVVGLDGVRFDSPPALEDKPPLSLSATEPPKKAPVPLAGPTGPAAKTPKKPADPQKPKVTVPDWE